MILMSKRKQLYLMDQLLAMRLALVDYMDDPEGTVGYLTGKILNELVPAIGGKDGYDIFRKREEEVLRKLEECDKKV